MKKVRHISAGFTLLEMTISMSIGMALLILAAGVLGETGKGYDSLKGDLQVEREARVAMDQLKLDLQSATFQADMRYERSSSDWPQDRIGFFSFQPPDAQSEAGHIGDLCAIHYYVRNLTFGGRSIRCLMRGFRESDETFQALKNGKVVDLFVPRDRDEPVAFGALAFEAVPEMRDDKGKWQDWSPATGSSPDRIILRLTIARRDLSSKLAAPQDWDQTGGLLGNPADVADHPQLEFYETAMRFGHYEKF